MPSLELLERAFWKRQSKLEAAEWKAGHSLVGPHRDDPIFLINGKSVRQYGSQGQQKSFILAFKTAQILDLEKILGEPPILLLDDMTGELDMFRQKFFFDFFEWNRPLPSLFAIVC